VYAYTTGNQLWTEDPPSPGLWRARGPFASDTVTNTYVNRLRTGLALQQPTIVKTVYIDLPLPKQSDDRVF